MKKGKANLIWIDLEMSGLDPETDVILEIATIATDSDLNILAEGPNLVIKREQSLFETMDSWNKKHHTASGLWEKVISSEITEQEAEKLTLNFIKEHSKSNTSPLCGNTIYQDRRFLAKYLKSIDSYLHYRIIDVSSLKELANRWRPDLVFTKKQSHRALDDIKESIEELKFFKDNFIQTSQP
ncbi:MAG: oligoribonuclease [Zetaproteobacteria bacterium]|nr:oligoribonuclease [Pseudobdellovibrionaceae bacterium]